MFKSACSRDVVGRLLFCFSFLTCTIEHRSKLGCASTTKIKTILFCIVFGFH